MLGRRKLFLEIAAALMSRGWLARGDSDGVAFTLDEAVVDGVMQIRLLFDPKQMWRLPQATLKNMSGTPKELLLHRYFDKFCYLDPTSVEWNPDSDDFVGHVVWLADRVVQELHRLQRGEVVTHEDAEFKIHWAGLLVYLDINDALWPPSKNAQIERLSLDRSEFSVAKPLVVYRLNNDDCRSRFIAFNNIDVCEVVPLVVANLREYPFPMHYNWPPSTLADLNLWLTRCKPSNGKMLWKDMADAMHSRRGSASNVLVLLDTRAGRYGALLVVDENIVNRFRRGSCLAEHLRGANILTRSIKVRRYSFERLDADFVLGRNAPEKRPVLADKQVHLVGAGAVGGQLADFLVQAGCGQGTGCLHIFDPDVYRPENSGRHLLGMPALGLGKAEALVAHLKRQRLAVNVFAHTVWAGDARLHRNADLVIDATSMPYLGAALSNAARAERRWALLSAFVEGEGWVAGAYLYRGVPGEACRDCLEPWIGGKGSHIREQYQHQPHDNGCGSSYTPYRAAAASIAAALASELACDWALNKATQRYRTIRLPSAPRHVAPGRMSSPTSRKNCICSLDAKSLNISSDIVDR